jgi:pimeloyl-ACP methyl ester carboxylesterase
VLWLAGADSPYVRAEHENAMRALFPRTRKVVVKDAGHWVHSQQPEVVIDLLRRLSA